MGHGTEPANILGLMAGSSSAPERRAFHDALRRHWPEYLMEAGGLGFFMICACLFSAALVFPSSPVAQAIPSPTFRRVLMGMAMGATAISIIYSPWGRRSGAHLNPAITLTFWKLGKVATPDAAFYIAAQFAGGIAGVATAVALLGAPIMHPSVRYATTVPGRWGAPAAFAAELAISFGLMTMVLNVSNSRHFAKWTGICAGCLVALYISLEAPLSGMSMNPARTFGSAWNARLWQGLWVYFTAPPLGMLLAAGTYVAMRGQSSVLCAKLHHDNRKRCIFHCGYGKVEHE